MLPVKLDLEHVLKRLSEEHRELARLLARFEGRIRDFETRDLPAYENWIRLELGPAFTVLDEIAERIRERRILAHRVNHLVQNEGLNPREALFVALAKPEGSPPEDPPEEEQAQESSKNGWDADEIEARRRAKLESKRARRKEEKRGKAREEKPAGTSVNRLVTLYRQLARKLHPDSPLGSKDISSEESLSLWHEVQTAYDTANLDRLLSIAAWLGTKEGDFTENKRSDEILSLSEKVERIRAMKKSVTRLESTLSHLRTHVAWEFQNKVGSEKKKLRKKAARELEDETARTQEVLDLLEDFIDSIGPPREPRKKRR
jgi:hypothetical protein